MLVTFENSLKEELKEIRFEQLVNYFENIVDKQREKIWQKIKRT